jgi:hypothetical protein
MPNLALNTIPVLPTSWASQWGEKKMRELCIQKLKVKRNVVWMQGYWLCID